MTALLERYGQSGRTSATRDQTYHNAFILADAADRGSEDLGGAGEGGGTLHLHIGGKGGQVGDVGQSLVRQRGGAEGRHGDWNSLEIF